MICDNRFFCIKRSRINCMTLLLLVLIASGCEGPSVERKEQQAEAVEVFLMKTPLVTVLAAGAYYENFGRWPSSVRDLEALQGEDFRDVDWESLRDTIVFEELPDGGLKIISTDPHIRFTVTLSARTDTDEDRGIDRIGKARQTQRNTNSESPLSPASPVGRAISMQKSL